MESNSNISLPRESCMKCGEKSDILMSAHRPNRLCDHKFCQICFRKENTDLACGPIYTFKCGYCSIPFYENMQSIDEAVIVGEAATIRTHIDTHLLPADVDIVVADVKSINKISMELVEKLESALLLNPTNFDTLYLLFLACCRGNAFLRSPGGTDSLSDFYGVKLYDYSFKLLEHPSLPEGYGKVRSECYIQIVFVFHNHSNYPAALKYSKLAYESCLRSSDHTKLSVYKDSFLLSTAAFAKLSPLRFAVGDEVEFLHELETGSEWKQGKVVDLYYHQRSFGLSFSAPYRLQLLDDSDSADQPPVYAWVKADLDRFVRKVGVRSIEDTRYQARLDAKVAKLARVYCIEEFIQDIYTTLAKDQDFVEMLQSVWQVELSEHTLNLYRALVMFRLPLVRTDTGYHVPSSEEVIAGIRAYFDPANLSSDAVSAAAGEDRDSQHVRIEIISLLRGIPLDTSNTTSAIDNSDIQWHLLWGIKSFIGAMNWVTESSESTVSVDMPDEGSGFTVPSRVSDIISKASIVRDLTAIVNYDELTRLDHYLDAWVWIQASLERPDAGSACECPFIYFFVKLCIEQDFGVPKLAMALYDRMNMQLSREFIRCANPTCELNKLDKSTGKVKFKQCSRCKTVIYCSRECQVAHYPEHKRLCREHSTGREGS